MDIGPGELIVVLLVVLLIFGSTRLPALGRSLGEAMREVRHWSDDAPEQEEPPAAADRQSDVDEADASMYD
ncbi:MAG: twin-arginine translocase TatA/TatE family subunit [Ilumatobacteraceae bacterium]